MMKNTILFGILILSVKLSAQVDSLTLDLNMYYAHHKEMLYDNPIYFSTFDVVDYTRLSLYGVTKEQSLRKRQEPNRTIYYGVEGEGVFHLNPKTSLLGTMNVANSRYKSSSYNLLIQDIDETQNEIHSPHYPFAKRIGNWENQHYHFSGGLMRKLSHQLFLAGKIHYNTDKYYKTIDPKPEISRLNFGGKISLGYKNNGYTFFANTGYKRRDVDYNISYTDAQTQDQPAAPLTFLRTSYGFGSVRAAQNQARSGFLQQHDIHFGGGILKKNKKYQAQIAYTYRDQQEKIYYKSYKDPNNLLGIFNIDSHKLTFDYQNTTSSLQWKIGGKLWLQKGTNAQIFRTYREDNARQAEATSNYKQNKNEITVYAGVLKKKETTTLYDISLETSYIEDKIVDLLAARKQIQYWNTTIRANKDLKITPKQKINLEGSIETYIPVTDKFQYTINPNASEPTLNDDFVNNVILPDMEYESNIRWSTSLQLQYHFRLLDQKSLIISSSVYFSKIYDQSHNYWNQNFNDNTNFNLGLIYRY